MVFWHPSCLSIYDLSILSSSLLRNLVKETLSKSNKILIERVWLTLLVMRNTLFHFWSWVMSESL